MAIDVAHTLASKVLHTPLFTAIDWSSPEFQSAKVFHLAGRILEGKASLPSMTVTQATTYIIASEDYEKVAKWRAKLVTETIASFDAHISNDRALTMSYDLPVSTGAAYLSDIAARPPRERCGIRPGVVRMVNDTSILVVSRTGGNATWVAPRYVMMDLGAQTVMICKKLAQELGLAAEDLAPCPYTIVTSVGHVERCRNVGRLLI